MNQQSEEFNPFSAPVSRSEVPVQNNSTVNTGTLNDYNPFDNQPAVLQTITTEQPKPEKNNYQTITSSELERRQKELEDRAAELNRREEAQRRLAQEMKGSLKNFPPLPNWFPMKPCFYQDIDVEISVEYRQYVRICFIIWAVYSVTLFVNIFGTLCSMITSQNVAQGGTLFGMSILWFILFVPSSYICWFRSLYKAFRSDSSFNFFMFFFIFFVQLIILFIQALGLNILGSCGWINSATQLRQNIGVGIFMLIIALSFSVIFTAGCLLLIKVHRVYRSTGASFEKAKAEFSRDLVTNPTVQSTATGVGSAAFSGAIRTNESGGRF